MSKDRYTFLCVQCVVYLKKDCQNRYTNQNIFINLEISKFVEMNRFLQIFFVDMKRKLVGLYQQSKCSTLSIKKINTGEFIKIFF